MSYHKITSFAVKDTMADNNPLKVVRGKEFDDEFDAITTAMDSQEALIANFVTTPTGGIIMNAAAVTPAGFLLCDGTARSRNTYTKLFQAIGTTFGAGDGSTTFNVPNLTNRFPYGGALGQAGGTADSIVPYHSHGISSTISDPGHTHSLLQDGRTVDLNNSQGPGNNGAGGFSGGQNVVTGQTSKASTTGITVSTTIAPTGVGVTNANLPPFLGLSFIIKI